ncbi:MAG: hypothetical protein MZW92_33200 [Comamonadaceae bacterium]|nr:hypothetical protein [Comamonadaceae bacterium]
MLKSAERTAAVAGGKVRPSSTWATSTLPIPRSLPVASSTRGWWGGAWRPAWCRRSTTTTGRPLWRRAAPRPNCGIPLGAKALATTSTAVPPSDLGFIDCGPRTSRRRRTPRRSITTRGP